MKKQGICLQIGISNIAEYAFCVDPGWQEQMPFEFPDIQDWQYYGVDVDPQSIAYCELAYPQHPQRNWFCVGIEDTLMIRDVDRTLWNFLALDDLPYIFSGVFLPLQTFCEQLHIKEIDIIAVDIEGGEYVLFADNAVIWDYSPRIIHVEVHLKVPHSYTTFMNAVCAKGYTCIRETPQNNGHEYNLIFEKNR